MMLGSAGTALAGLAGMATQRRRDEQKTGHRPDEEFAGASRNEREADCGLLQRGRTRAADTSGLSERDTTDLAPIKTRLFIRWLSQLRNWRRRNVGWRGKDTKVDYADYGREG